MNQYLVFNLFSENTTRRPWHQITVRAHQDQPYSNESPEIQTHNHLLKATIHAKQRPCVVIMATEIKLCSSYETLGCELI